MVVIEKKTKNIITISFSAKVGSSGLKRIKKFIETIEAQSLKPSQRPINKLADEIDKAIWERRKKNEALTGQIKNISYG